MTDFNSGDKVICINDNLSCLYKEQEYTIKEVVYFGDYGIILEGFPNTSFYPERFSKVIK